MKNHYIGIIVVVVAFFIVAFFADRYSTTEKPHKLIPIVVVEKTTRPGNPAYEVAMQMPTSKFEIPKRTFKRILREPEFIVVAIDGNGIEYNVRVGRIDYLSINLLDTLWSTQ